MEHNKSKELIQLIPTNHQHVFNVQLNLEHQTRYIGKLDTAGEGTFITNRSEKHLLIRLHALGLNYSLLSNSSIPFKNIVINYCGKKLQSTREYFLKKGTTLHFSKKGFELQSFLPIEEINLNNVRYFERSNGYQTDLFTYNQ